MNQNSEEQETEQKTEPESVKTENKKPKSENIKLKPKNRYQLGGNSKKSESARQQMHLPVDLRQI